MIKGFTIFRGKIREAEIFTTRTEAALSMGGVRGWLVVGGWNLPQVVEVIRVAESRTGRVVYRRCDRLEDGGLGTIAYSGDHDGRFFTSKRAAGKAWRAAIRARAKELNTKHREKTQELRTHAAKGPACT